jgi:hypothetical protein
VGRSGVWVTSGSGVGRFRVRVLGFEFWVILSCHSLRYFQAARENVHGT